MMMNKKNDSNNDRNNKGDEKMPNDVKLNSTELSSLKIPESPQMSSILPRSQKKSTISTMNTLRILGEEYTVDQNTLKRVRIGQLGVGIFSVVTAALVILMDQLGNNLTMRIAILMSFFIALIFVSFIYVKNVSFVILKRMFHEPNVVFIIILSICNWAIDLIRPSSSNSWAYGILYILVVVPFVFIDAIQIKSRYFVLGVGCIFFILQIRNIYGNTIGDDSYGIVLFKYTINGIEYEIEKRSMKRNIYMQVLLFSVNGLYVMITDKQMKKMMFGTDSIFRETGTTSEVIENIRHSEMYRLELRRSISDK